MCFCLSWVFVIAVSATFQSPVDLSGNYTYTAQLQLNCASRCNSGLVQKHIHACGVDVAALVRHKSVRSVHIGHENNWTPLLPPMWTIQCEQLAYYQHIVRYYGHGRASVCTAIFNSVLQFALHSFRMNALLIQTRHAEAAMVCAYMHVRQVKRVHYVCVCARICVLRKWQSYRSIDKWCEHVPLNRCSVCILLVRSILSSPINRVDSCEEIGSAEMRASAQRHLPNSFHWSFSSREAVAVALY